MVEPILIRPLQEPDIPVITAIHCQQFPRSRSTSLGPPFVRKMYRWFFQNQPHLALVAEHNGKPIGFVVGSMIGSGRKIFRYAFPEVILGFILHPQIILRARTFALWRSYLKAFIPGRKPVQAASSNPDSQPGKYAGLSSIAVDRMAQGQGIGKALVYAFETAARAQGANRIGLSVEADNLVAHRTYESCDWVRQEQPVDQNSFAYYKELGLSSRK